MVIHYAPSQESVACGRTGSNLNSNADLALVSCRLCLRSVEKKASEPLRKTPSLAELRAAAKAAKATQVHVEQAKPAPSLTPRAEWEQRLQQMPGRNRLPRGVSRQAFI